jgi:hypothetical protein
MILHAEFFGRVLACDFWVMVDWLERQGPVGSWLAVWNFVRDAELKASAYKRLDLGSLTPALDAGRAVERVSRADLRISKMYVMLSLFTSSTY